MNLHDGGKWFVKFLRWLKTKLIQFQAGIILDKKAQNIPWNDLRTKKNSRYYTIFSKENPDNYKAFYYLDDWNTAVLYSVSRYILKAKK